MLLSIRDYVRLAVPEPEVLQIIGQESKKRHEAHGYPDRPDRQTASRVQSTDDRRGLDRVEPRES